MISVDQDKYRAATGSEIEFLRGIIRMMPAGVSVQDEFGNILLVNDAAARMAGPSPQAPMRGLSQRREACEEALRTGQVVVTEEVVKRNGAQQVLLTSHSAVRLSGRKFVISASTDITEQKDFEDQLFRSAYFDSLTGLPSRRVIEHHAHSIIARAGPRDRFALAFLDIDNFKHINDYYGHSIGDGLLVELSKRLGRDLRDSDMLSRISGDEFLLLLSPIESAQDVDEFMKSTLSQLTAPFFIDGSEIFASTSVGISLYPDDGRAFEVLCQNADLAMYRVKNEGKGATAFFDATMEREAVARMKIEQALRLAILERRFCCAFQPKVDIRTHKVKGIEALVRLRDDEGVIQAPGSFINLASELGLIDELTHLVLAEIVKSIDLINDVFGAASTISINVAARQASNTTFMASFVRALEETGFPRRFMIEVTEDAFVAKGHFQCEILPMLRRLGVGISIDDFGTGFSSLSALADITADEIKIDRSFITNIHLRPRSQGILRAIESLSESLGMTVIAEGIETYEELAYLQATSKIRYAQGYYFSQPIFLEQLKSVSPVTSSARVELASRIREQSRHPHLLGRGPQR
ncbi:MAG: EAL domain-containing protein [Alphaproteobacteria bacterium]|nr:EAL domain-containing protein [Alphaproteobacteria bacterium]